MNMPLVEQGTDWPDVAAKLLYRTDRCQFWQIDFSGKWPEIVTEHDKENRTYSVCLCAERFFDKNGVGRVTFFGIDTFCTPIVQRFKRQILVAFLQG